MIVATCSHRGCWNPKPCPNPKHKSTDDFYSSRRWRNERALYLKVNPLCAHCKSQTPPRFKEAQEVDHITPIVNGGHRFKWENLQGLCKSHHSQKTRRENLD